MTDQGRVIPWTGPGWLERASAWMHAELEHHGIKATGRIELAHSRPWSTVLRMPTIEGDFYLKAASPLAAHEPALLQTLSRLRPDCIPELLSVDVEQGWVLMRDAGRSLHELIRSTRQLRPWLSVLPLYAELQIEMADHLPELLALGVPDQRLSVLPGLYDQLLADMDVLRIDRTPGLTRAQHQRLLDLSPRVVELCERLAGYRIPEGLNHGDLHDGNVFIHDGRFSFADWGDSSVSHPFYSLRTVLVSAEISLGLEETAPELQLLSDAYLEPWTLYESRQCLIEALDLARRLASVSGALVWSRLVSRFDEPLREEYAEPVPALLQEFLNAETAAPA